jgi:hypothetical protein
VRGGPGDPGLERRARIPDERGEGERGRAERLGGGEHHQSSVARAGEVGGVAREVGELGAGAVEVAEGEDWVWLDGWGMQGWRGVRTAVDAGDEAYQGGPGVGDYECGPGVREREVGAKVLEEVVAVVLDDVLCLCSSSNKSVCIRWQRAYRV